MTALRLGSLFDGIGVFPLAAVRCGIEPVWASEIEKAPNLPVPPPEEKPLDKVREHPPKRRSREREER